MDDAKINIALESNFHRGVAEGMQRAIQILNQANAEEIERRQETAKAWFGEDTAEDSEEKEE